MRVRLGVDDLFTVPHRGGLWCHLLCDDFSLEGLRVLHAFAEQIGAPLRAFHNPAGHPRPHYDLTPGLRQMAIDHGAELFSRFQVVEFLQRGRRSAGSLQIP